MLEELIEKYFKLSAGISEKEKEIQVIKDSEKDDKAEMSAITKTVIKMMREAKSKHFFYEIGNRKYLFTVSDDRDALNISQLDDARDIKTRVAVKKMVKGINTL